MPTDKKLKSYAKHLRHNQTAAERGLWVLRLFYFRAQRPVRGYVPDFYNPILRVAVEVYGGVHDRADVKARDKRKRKNLQAKGIYTMYVSNDYARLWPIVLIEALATGGVWWLYLILKWSWPRIKL